MSDSDLNKAEAQLIQSVRSAAVNADDVSIAGLAELDTVKATQTETREKKQRDSDLALQVRATNEYLDRLETLIAETRAEIDRLRVIRDQALEAAQDACDRMHEAEDLLDAIKDGISEEERQRLIALFGEGVKDANTAELAILLQAKIDKEHETGMEKSEEAELAAKDIADKEAKIRTWEAEVKAYENAPLAEHREAIENKTVSDDTENREAERATDIEFNALSFR